MIKKQRYFSEKDIIAALNIHRRLNSSIRLVNRVEQLGVCQCLGMLPKKVIDYVVANYVLIGMSKDELGSQYPFDHPYFFGKKGFILLGSKLWNRRPIEKAMVVAHEVAHAVIHDKYIGDKRSTFKKRLEMEEEANRLAIKWLSKRYSKERLLEICQHSYLIL